MIFEIGMIWSDGMDCTFGRRYIHLSIIVLSSVHNYRYSICWLFGLWMIRRGISNCHSFSFPFRLITFYRPVGQASSVCLYNYHGFLWRLAYFLPNMSSARSRSYCFFWCMMLSDERCAYTLLCSSFPLIPFLFNELSHDILPIRRRNGPCQIYHHFYFWSIMVRLMFVDGIFQLTEHTFIPVSFDRYCRHQIWI